MPRRIKKYRGVPDAMFGPLFNTDGESGGGVAAPPKPTPPTDKPTGDPEPDAGKSKDEPLGEGGKKALEREREARRTLETQMTQMRDAFTQALGIKQDTKADPGELVAQMQQQLADMQHQSLVDRVARESGVTDADDLEFLASAKDEEQMRKFANRLASGASPGTPKPDASQGARGAENKPDPGPGVARLSSAFEAELDK